MLVQSVWIPGVNIISHLFLCLSPLTGAEESDAASRREERQKRSPPYWGLWSSDFFGWLEELRAQAAHEGMQDLARTFWAHFPIANELGYDGPESDPQPEE
uniref:Otospiralin n=1 Tax=Dicentrarchus labrax TaxID=13489 RepID=A0A8C4H361_DICLA